MYTTGKKPDDEKDEKMTTDWGNNHPMHSNLSGATAAVDAPVASEIVLEQGCQTQFLEGCSPAEFSSNPAPTHKPSSFQISLKDVISWIRCV